MERQIDDKIIAGSPNLPTSEAVRQAIVGGISNLNAADLFNKMNLGNFNINNGWGTVKSANGYSMLFGGDQPSGGGLEIGEKSGQTSIQIDGDFYGQEGAKKVAYADDVLALSGGTVTGILNSANHNFIVASNEFNFLPDGYSGGLYINYLPGTNRSGTASCTNYIFVKGNGSTSDYANITCYDLNSSHNVYASSDLRLKDNIQKNTFDLLSILDKIKIKQFVWKIEEDKNNQNIGVIAQELQKILPQELQKEFISQNNEGYLSVNDSKFVYLLIDAYQQEKQKRIELEERIKKLEDKLGV